MLRKQDKPQSTEIYVETLQRGKPRKQSFTMYSGYTIQNITSLSKCVSRTWLFASAVTHTAMARLTLLSTSHSHAEFLLFSSTHTLKFALVAYIFTQLSSYLHTQPSWGAHSDYLQVQSPELAIYTIPVSASVEFIINSAPLSSLFDCRIPNSRIFLPLEGLIGGTYSQH